MQIFILKKSLKNQKKKISKQKKNVTCDRKGKNFFFFANVEIVAQNRHSPNIIVTDKCVCWIRRLFCLMCSALRYVLRSALRCTHHNKDFCWAKNNSRHFGIEQWQKKKITAALSLILTVVRRFFFIQFNFFLTSMIFFLSSRIIRMFQIKNILSTNLGIERIINL